MTQPDYKKLCQNLIIRLQWYINEDDVNENLADDNEYWIQGKHSAIQAIADATHQTSVTPPNPPLSPAAQAVLDAFTALENGIYLEGDPDRLAAALRAAADQVVPDNPRPSADSDYHLMHWSKSLDQYAQRQQTRAELLAIAAELEGQP